MPSKANIAVDVSVDPDGHPLYSPQYSPDGSFKYVKVLPSSAAENSAAPGSSVSASAKGGSVSASAKGGSVAEAATALLSLSASRTMDVAPPPPLLSHAPNPSLLAPLLPKVGSVAHGPVAPDKLGSLHVCKGHRNESWLRLIDAAYSSYADTKHKFWKREVVRRTMEQWLASGGVFLSKSTKDGSMYVLDDHSSMYVLSQHFFRLHKQHKPPPGSNYTLPTHTPSLNACRKTSEVRKKNVETAAAKIPVTIPVTAAKKNNHIKKNNRVGAKNNIRSNRRISASNVDTAKELSPSPKKSKTWKNTKAATKIPVTIPVTAAKKNNHIKKNNRVGAKQKTPSKNKSNNNGASEYCPLPKEREAGEELNAEQMQRLRFAGVSPQVENIATNAWFEWKSNIGPCKDFLLKAKSPHGHSNSFISRSLELHRSVIRPVKRKFPLDQRREWPKWLPPYSDAWRGYIATVALVTSAKAHDKQVKGIIELMRKEKHVTSPHSLLDIEGWRGKGGLRYCDFVWAIGKVFGTIYYNRKASYVAMITFIAIIEGRMPSKTEEVLAFKGIRLKMLFEAMKDGFNSVDGIGCDSHMCSMFCALGWVSDKVRVGSNKYNHDEAAVQMMSWLPKSLWSEMNEVYAGLGQLLNMPDLYDEVTAALLKAATNVSNWHVRMVKSILLLYGKDNRKAIRQQTTKKSPAQPIEVGDVGYTFQKYFPSFGWFQGEVTAIRMGAQSSKNRRCRYSDGDEEDLSLRQIKKLKIC